MITGIVPMVLGAKTTIAAVDDPLKTVPARRSSPTRPSTSTTRASRYGPAEARR
jgi:hypothetical protein